MRKVLFSCGIFGALALAVACALLLRGWQRATCPVPILMYHEVGEATGSAWCVPVETFRSQMIALREQGYKTVLPSDIAARRKWGKPLPRKPVIITFDDGYLCNLSVIEPILKDNGFRAVIFLITSRIAETKDGRGEYEGKSCLAWPEVLEMQKRRTFAFGGHSHSHSNLAAMGDPLSDILECRRQLETHGVHRPYAFCYPYGQHKPETRAAARQAGFQTAFVCEDAVASVSPATDLFALPRVSVMGGQHSFSLLGGRFDPLNKTLDCRIVHEGIPIEICARLDGDGPCFPQWSSARLIDGGVFDLSFSLPDAAAASAANRLQIMDKHRLFCLANFRR